MRFLFGMRCPGAIWLVLGLLWIHTVSSLGKDAIAESKSGPPAHRMYKPWSYIWFTVETAQVTVKRGSAEEALLLPDGPIPPLPKEPQSRDLHWAGIFSRHDADEFLSRFHPASGWEVQHHLLPGPLHETRVTLKLPGDGAGFQFPVALKLDRLTLKVMESTVWDGQVVALNWEISRTKENAVHRVVLIQAETLDVYDPQLPAGTPLRPREEAVLEVKNSRLRHKLAQTILPKLELKMTDLKATLTILKRESGKVAAHGTNFTDVPLMFVTGPSGEPENPNKVNLDLVEVPLSDGLRYVAEILGTRYFVRDGVIEVPNFSGDPGEVLEAKEIKVPPHFMEWLKAHPAMQAEPTDTFAPTFDFWAHRANADSSRPKSLRDLLEQRGINFPKGASIGSLGGDSLQCINDAYMTYKTQEVVEEAWAEIPASFATEAKKIALPQLEFHSTSLKDAVAAILAKARAVNSKTEIKVRMEADCDGERTLTWSGEKMPVFEALITVAKLTGHEVRADKAGISIRRAAMH